MLNILYVATLCSDDVFSKLFSVSRVKPQQQAQKFHSLLAKGLADSGASVTTLTRPPVDHVDRTRFSIADDIDRHKINFHYLSLSRFSPVRHFVLFVQAFFYTLFWCYLRRDARKFVVCDVLNFSISAGAMLAARFFGVKSVAVVTDLPGFLNFSRDKRGLSRIKRSVYQWLSDGLVGKYDYYMVLTEDINRVVNRRCKPHVVIEGMVDSEMASSRNTVEEKYSERVVIYAGALYEKFGVGKLIDAFSKVHGDDIRLWLYGSGDMEPEIRIAAERDARIRYFGVVPNADVVKEQLKATLLVNPRPSNEEFTKYSFPSKNMEYMVSGTPLLTTPLPGMPYEYVNYVYLFEDESVEGMASTLARVLTLPRSDLHEVGLNSKKFVLDKKNNRAQALVLMKMIQTV